MKKLTAILAVFVVCAVQLGWSHAETYDECKMRVTMDIMRKGVNSYSRYNDIVSEMTKESESNYEQWLNTVRTDAVEGNCNGLLYNCAVGQKNRDCVPQECWTIHKKTALSIQIDSKQQFEDEMLSKECSGVPADAAKAAVIDKKQAAAGADSGTGSESVSRKAAKENSKEIECARKGKVAKQIAGIWQCVDSDETKAANAKEKADAKIRDAYFDDINKIHRAYNNKLRQLQKKNK